MGPSVAVLVQANSNVECVTCFLRSAFSGMASDSSIWWKYGGQLGDDVEAANSSMWRRRCTYYQNEYAVLLKRIREEQLGMTLFMHLDP